MAPGAWVGKELAQDPVTTAIVSVHPEFTPIWSGWLYPLAEFEAAKVAGVFAPSPAA